MSEQSTPPDSSQQERVEYRDIPGCPGYKVGSDGSVWSRLRPQATDRDRLAAELRAQGKTFKAIAEQLGYRCGAAVFKMLRSRAAAEKWRRLKPGPDRKGYLYVCLRGRKIKVHRLVLGSFVGACPDGMEACHINSNRRDNRLVNLRWDTHRNNLLDRNEHGTSNHGERNGCAKLDTEKVRKIRLLYAEKQHSHLSLARLFGVSQTSVALIVTRKRWRHV